RQSAWTGRRPMLTALAAFRALRLSISGGGPICWCLVLYRIGRPQFSAWVWPDVGDHRRCRHRVSRFEARSDYGENPSSSGLGEVREFTGGSDTGGSMWSADWV